MALDRERIEKKDFPSARQGYSRPAVDAHLKAIADELERSPSSRPTLASSASDRVRTIVEAAESSAAEIRAEAEQEAEGLRRDALADAHVQTERVAETASAALAQLDAARRELETLIASLHGDAAPPGPSAAPVVRAAPVASAPPEPELVVAEPPAPAEIQEPAPVLTLAAEPSEPSEPAPSPHAATDSGDPDPEAEGARLIALNMALDGTPREDTAKYLDEHFELADADALLDEVYARVGG